MKTCDKCGYADDVESHHGAVYSVLLGVTRDTGESLDEYPIECELCQLCTKDINTRLIKLAKEVGIPVRK